MRAFHGGCACGQVRYEVAAAPLQVVACHCNLCRRMTGSPFSVYLVARAKDLRIVTGEPQLRTFQATERTTRHFCGSCGTPVYNANPVTYRGLAMVYAGTADDPRPHAPTMDIFCESRLDWIVPNPASQVFDRAPGPG
ncbi:MAG TPA: GFA family protein [Ramlibacter sp.]|jgi:hypothetical protein|uniref:GFA family protein n=1 Tax=Ramlibacter sp. TaxID=1917967 RepID=UPI002D309B17|nr:GFA family protein [Ramlibacter sp.]HZY18399.1 GFA family protein [Ramlibacter sp.]